jgi:hypothetical protein
MNGPGGGLFPALDADICLTPAGEHSARCWLVEAGWATQRARGAPYGVTGIPLIRRWRLRCLLRE